MADTTKRHPQFWDILKELAAEVPYKTIASRYQIPLTTVNNYRHRFTETVVRVKDNVADDSQLKFKFVYDKWRNKPRTEA